jgi:hypothetical protein
MGIIHFLNHVHIGCSPLSRLHPLYRYISRCQLNPHFRLAFVETSNPCRSKKLLRPVTITESIEMKLADVVADGNFHKFVDYSALYTANSVSYYFLTVELKD